MSCKACGSNNLSKYTAEMNLHFPGYAGLEKPTVWVFPEVVICIDCGFSEFSVAKPQLSELAKAAGT
jgi:predicted nucleic-acid-binding Zn-ribbon protein